jgi:hypothetical protein
MKNNPQALTVGDRVTYNDVNLLDTKGTVSAIGPQVYGGDCLVTWDHFPLSACIECLRCLRKED